MSTKTKRKDPIVIDSSLIGREVFFKGKAPFSYLTSEKKYKVLDIAGSSNLITESDNQTPLHIRINDHCAHLRKHGWLLAKRTSSSQSVVRTESGRKL